MSVRASPSSKQFRRHLLYLLALYAACTGSNAEALNTIERWGQKMDLPLGEVDALLTRLKCGHRPHPVKHLVLREDPATVRAALRELAAAHHRLTRREVEFRLWVEKLLASRPPESRRPSATPHRAMRDAEKIEDESIPGILRAACYAIHSGDLLLAEDRARHAHEESPSKASLALLALIGTLKVEYLRCWLLTRHWVPMVAPPFVRETMQLTLPERFFLERLDAKTELARILRSPRLAVLSWSEDETLLRIQWFVDAGLVLLEEQ